MKTFNLSLKKRTETGKSVAKKLRAKEKVLCEIYGNGRNIHCYGDYVPFQKAIYTPDVYLFNLDIEGEKVQAVIQEVQFHPVTDRLLHVDFIEVDQKKPVKVSLPVELTGSSVGVMRGGKLRQLKRKLTVEGLVNALPETIKIDISKLDVGHSLKVADLSIEGIKFLDPKQTVIVNIGASRATQKAE